MAAVSAELVKQLREKTGAGIMDCREALIQSNADFEKAIDFLRKKGLATAQKRAGKTLSEGLIEAYIHLGGKIGVMVEVNCETDFVAKTDDFKTFVRNVAMHIAASNPLGVKKEDIPEQIVQREKEIYKAQVQDMGKPAHVVEKIIEGKMSKFYQESCLLNQPYVKNPDITVADYLNEIIAKTGENISIRRFVRYQLGG